MVKQLAWDREFYYGGACKSLESRHIVAATKRANIKFSFNIQTRLGADKVSCYMI